MRPAAEFVSDDAAVVELINAYRGQLIGERRSSGQSEASATEFADIVAAEICEHLHLCESPIEERVLVATIFAIAPHVTDKFKPVCDYRLLPIFSHSPTLIIPQFHVGPYRLDFCIRALGKSGKPVLIAIECDGKDFHSSRQQLDRDTVRDGFLLQLGFQVHRLTGREINKSDIGLINRMRQIIWEAEHAG